MTIGKATKEETRLLLRTYKHLKRNTNNLTLKDFADLIEFMSEPDDTDDNEGGQQGAPARRDNRPILGLGNYLNQRNQARLNALAAQVRLRAQVRLHAQARLQAQARINAQARLNNQAANGAANNMRPGLNFRRNEWDAPPEPEKKKENDRTLPQPPGGRVVVEYIEK